MNAHKLTEMLEKADGVWGMAVKQIGRDIIFEYNADLEFPAASVGKVPIALYIFHLIDRGVMNLDQTFTVREEDRLPGTGVLQFLTSNVELTLEDLIKMTLIVSDNTAAKLLTRTVGPEHINEYLESLGFKKIRLGIHGEQFDFGTITAREITALLEGIYSSAFLSKKYSDMMLGIMKKCENTSGIRRYLPRVVSGQKLEVANKGGALDDVRNDIGIVFTKEPYVISILSNELTDDSYSPDNEGFLEIARLSEEAYNQLGHSAE